MSLSGDKASRLNFFQRGYYLIGNYIQNVIGNMQSPKNIAVSKRINSILSVKTESITAQVSPSRLCCNLFWGSLPWERINSVLNDVSVCDIGCGDGHYSENLRRWSDNNLSYSGYDVKSNDKWKSIENINTSFEAFDGVDFDSILKKDFNLFTSQSALEHISNDLKYFKSVRDYIEENKKPVIQVHLVPSSKCLMDYLFHGVRQYSSGNFNNIMELYSSDVHNSYLFPLGGPAASSLHRKRILIPNILRRLGFSKPHVTHSYEAELHNLILNQEETSVKNASFHAFVIESYLPKPIMSEML